MVEKLLPEIESALVAYMFRFAEQSESSVVLLRFFSFFGSIGAIPLKSIYTEQEPKHISLVQ